MEKQSEYSYYAFISYSSKDAKWAKWLLRRLENYSLPSVTWKQILKTRKFNQILKMREHPIQPVFLDCAEIQPGVLEEVLRENLRESQYLIVIASPNSAKSKWVGDEIKYFHSLGREKNIFFLIVDGDKPEEYFHPVLKELGMPEMLGADVNYKYSKFKKINRDRAYIQIISKLLGLKFDDLWKRHRRRLIKNISMSVVGAILVIAALIGVWVANRPVDIDVQLTEKSFHNENLPPLKNAIVTLCLDDEIKIDTISDLDDFASFVNVPHFNLGTKVGLSIVCRDWQTIDTTIVLARQMNIDMQRNVHVYGDVDFSVWNSSTERSVPNFAITVDKYDVVSDDKGRVRLFIPLEEQRTAYKVKSSIPLVYDFVHLPHGENDVVIIK